MTSGQVASNLISLLLVIAFANLLPKETYGLYRYILSLGAVLSIFTLTGMNNAVSRAVATGDESALRASVKYQLKWNLLMLLAFWSMAGYYFLNGNTLLSTSFIILGIFTPATLALNTYGAYLDGKREFGLSSISGIISTFIYASGMFVVLLLGGEVIWLVAAYSITTFLATYFFYRYTVNRFRLPVSITPEVLQYGRQLTFIGFISPIAAQIDKIILTHYWGPAQLAVYTLAMAVPEKASSLIKNLVGLGAPKFATKTAEEINSVFYNRILQGMSVGIVLTVLYVLVSPYLFKYLLPQYLEGVFYSQILSMSFIFAMPNRYISLILESQKLTRLLFIRSVVQSIITILLYIILGIWGGILGLAVAFVLNSFSGMLLNIVMWQSRGS